MRWIREYSLEVWTAVVLFAAIVIIGLAMRHNIDRISYRKSCAEACQEIRMCIRNADDERCTCESDCVTIEVPE